MSGSAITVFAPKGRSTELGMAPLSLSGQKPTIEEPSNTRRFLDHHAGSAAKTVLTCES